MVNNKAQLRIQEMAFMLIAVVFFFILVGLFALSIFIQHLREESTSIKEDRTLTSLTNLADSPEFYCVSSKSNCIDGDKAISLLNKTSYQDFWAFSSLAIVKSSGFSKNRNEMIDCNWANYPDCDIITVYDKGLKNERIISSYVAFCRKEYYEKGYTYDKCEIGKIIAGTEIKTSEVGDGTPK